MKVLDYNNLDTNEKDEPNKVIWDWLFLDNFLENLQPNSSLEIGVDKGLTFSLLHKYSHHSLGIEIYENSYPKEWNILFQDSKKLTEKDLGKDMFFDFIHIDGDHSYESAINDLTKCQPHINDETIICVDDYQSKDVIDAVNTFLKKNKQMFLKFYGINQIFLVSKKSEDIFDKVINKFDKNIVKLLKLRPVLNLDIWPTDNDIKMVNYLSQRSEFQSLQPKLESYLKLQ